MLGNPVMIAQDLEWRAQDDARTLANAKQIMADEARHSAAQAAAKAVVDKAMKEAKAMKSVAEGGDPTRASSAKDRQPEIVQVKGKGHITNSMAAVPLTRIKNKKG